MKCIKLTSSKKVVRCEDMYAEILVEKKMGGYTSKEAWKADGRNYLEERDKYVLLKTKGEVK